ncbi:hypothetical protein JOF28_001037 [Leucobacter exalbidus]|uniref:DUF4194 domain-containing protein n=1 Tax=Leucobacter exalbidus TaxID=662960 RepID=A0A940PT85_9MICO|nr:DUF4194 domain-containing protein [Leucobacter exalbidus]MBP1325805.1 hypothetical protein [Leucobacter exalbidus]
MTQFFVDPLLEEHAEGSTTLSSGLWEGDSGTLADSSRRALLKLIQGPYLSSKQHSRLWTALLADRVQIQSRLHDLFLDVVIDEVDELAFTRKVHAPEFDAPSALRNVALTYADTILLLVLRQQLLATGGGRRTIVSQTEIFEQLAIYRNSDTATYARNLNSAWTRMSKQYRVIHTVDDDRVEVSPLVKFMIDEERVRALTQVYEKLAGLDPQSHTTADLPEPTAESSEELS